MFRRRRQARPTSIFEHISAHVPADGPGLREGGDVLPDDGSGTMWAPGAQDGVLLYHWGGSAEPRELERLCEALAAAVRGRSGHDALVETVRGMRVISLVDDLLGWVRGSGLDPEDVYRLAYRLATEARDREAVKLGIALLGLYSADHHRDELMTLGRHDEFTIFAMVALANREGDVEADLWDLARNVTGWGRIHVVERLADTGDPLIRDWILREGFRNDVMDQYLAGAAATSGDLAGRLAAAPDDDLLIAASDLFDVLCEDGGPVEGISGYEDGERAAGLFLGHMATRADDLRHYFAVRSLQTYATEHWPHLADRCAEILQRPLWADLARLGLASTDEAEFYRASRACRMLGVPTLQAHLNRVRDEPYDPRHWHSSMQEADTGTLSQVLDLATDLLPLTLIATGPAEEDGFGPDFAPHRCLDAFLPKLGEWPGQGWPIVAAGLASPVVRNRNMAIRTLAAWDESAWPAQARDAVTAALAREPDADVRERLRLLLEGRPVE
ncbi:hypothetical protein SMC26_20440 [Actinomadura fulvescens]|uniref:HEAT repeat domain-containing protein n=1 Tax=Actinomadura fulvescens TaxID=46160 RepID=A0ABN3PMU8_9ACTN